MKHAFWPAAMLILLLAGSTARSDFLLQEKKTAEVKKSESAADKSREPLLEIVGTMAAGHLYQTYLNIGFIADNKAQGIYEEKDARQILATVLALHATIDKQLENASKLDLSKEDRERIENIRGISKLLRQQADELQAFWKTGEKQNGEKYELNRTNAWKGISKLLQLEKTGE